ncbi:hypothetical protein MMC34_008720 [Xylographa carneopallida]|nr:hypothetical protein [Xylographa carneopallida]
MSSHPVEVEQKDQASYSVPDSPAASYQPDPTALASPSVPYRSFLPDGPATPSVTTTPAGTQVNPTGATAVLPAAACKTEPVSVWRELYNNPRLLLVIVFACFGGLLFGYDTGIIGGVTSLPDFRAQFDISLPGSNGVDSQATADEISWIVSSFLLGAAASALVTGPTADVISRRWTIFWGAVLFTIGGALQGAAYTVAQLIVGRVVAGLAVGALSTVIPIYNAELSSPEVRGTMNTLFQLAITAGILLAFLLNLGFKQLHPYGWRLSLAIQSAFSLFLVFGTLLLPESPRWYMVKRREAEAIAVLTRLRNNKPVDPELAARAIVLAAIGAGDDAVVDGKHTGTFNAPVERTAANAAQFDVVKIPHNTLEQEVEEMRASILHQERIGESHWRDVFSTPLRARVALGTGVQGWQQLTGSQRKSTRHYAAQTLSAPSSSIRSSLTVVVSSSLISQ